MSVSDRALIRTGVSLRERTSFRIGGAARFHATPRDPEQLLEALSFAAAHGLEARYLGGGTNLLVEDGVHDLLVVDLNGLRGLRFVGDMVFAGAGERLSAVVRGSCRHGLAGIAELAGIPGTVGGALIMNAGGHGCAFGDRVVSVSVLDETGIKEISGEDAGFAYRASALGPWPVLSVALRLQPGCPRRLRDISRRTVLRKHNTQPLRERSAGCVFKNPPGESAGRLIDSAGLKGLCVGGARVSDMHANFIVVSPGAASADVLELIRRVEDAMDARDIRLEREVRVWRRAS